MRHENHTISIPVAVIIGADCSKGDANERGAIAFLVWADLLR